MPQLILLGLVAVGGFFIWRVVKREMARVDRELQQARAEKAEQSTTNLEQDPGTGRYRPKADDR